MSRKAKHEKTLKIMCQDTLSLSRYNTYFIYVLTGNCNNNPIKTKGDDCLHIPAAE